MSVTDTKLQNLATIRSNYEAKGYTVRFDTELPEPFKGFHAEIVATKDDENVLVLLRPADRTPEQIEHLIKLGKLIDSEPGWRTELISFNPADLSAIPDEADARRRLDEAREVFNISVDAALLLTWSAIEGGLWTLSQRNARPSKPRPRAPRKLIRELLIDGVISDGLAVKLDDFAQVRDLVAHGWDADAAMQPEELEWFIGVAQQLFDDTIATTDKMVDWFCDHYQSPDDACLPYESREGGYQWLGRGPHNAEDVLRDQFPDAVDEDICEATKTLESDSQWWASRDDRD